MPKNSCRKTRIKYTVKFYSLSRTNNALYLKPRQEGFEFERGTVVVDPLDSIAHILEKTYLTFKPIIDNLTRER